MVCAVILGREGNQRVLLMPKPLALARCVTARDQTVGGISIASVAAAAFKAACNWSGNSFPRFSARRRIPAQAFGLKKYRCGRSPVSKISDNEDATAPLWNSEVLSVKNPVGEPIPEFCQEPEEGTKIPSSVRRQDAGDILPNHPTGPDAANHAKADEGHVAARVIQAETLAGDAERLAGRPEDDEINRGN
jgi:hypothetical protein